MALPPSDRPLLPKRADPAPAPTRFALPFSFVAGALTFTTVLYVVAVRNTWTWACRAWVVYFTVCYLLLLAYLISFRCVDHFPRGSAASACALRVFRISTAGLIAACLAQPYVY